MKNFEIRDRLAELVRQERRITSEVLELLRAAMAQVQSAIRA